MIRVIIESPFAADTPEGLARNARYRDRAIFDSLMRNEAPLASHRDYTGVLDDSIPKQRRLGMEAGFAWGEVAQLTAVYVDYGISPGMQEGIDRALAAGRPVEFRRIGP